MMDRDHDVLEMLTAAIDDVRRSMLAIRNHRLRPLRAARARLTRADLARVASELNDARLTLCEAQALCHAAQMIVAGEADR